MKIVRTTERYFNLTTQAIKAYFDRKGIKSYFYFLNLCNLEYELATPDENHIVTYITIHEPIDPDNVNSKKFFKIEDIKRDDVDLVAIVEEYGSEFVYGYPDGLVVIDIPDDVKWYIKEGELGDELIVEEHRTW